MVGAGASPARRKYRHRDADHVPSGGSGRVPVVRRAARLGNEAPEATGGGAEVLDAISGPSILSAPSGKTYGTGRRSAGSTRLSTKSRDRRSLPSTSCPPLWTGCGERP